LAALPPDKQAELLRRLRRRPAAPPAAATAAGPAAGQAAGPGQGEWVVPFRPTPDARLRLFCFSYAGGGASVFRSWPDLLPADVDVCGIALPGREARLGEPAYRRLPPLVSSLAEAMAPLLDREFVFFGHSMGALVAFELARELRRVIGREPARLLLAAFRAPQLPDPNIPIHHLPDEVLKIVLQTEGTSPDILRHDELMQAILPMLRADLELCHTYEHVPGEPLACPISVFGGEGDVRVRPADLEQWRCHTTAEFDVTILPGSHFFLHSARDLLLATVQQKLS
jgi:surfactin synthase thioesterase subunit